MLRYLRKCLRRGLESLLTDDQAEPAPVEPYLDALVGTPTGPLLVKYLIQGTTGPRLKGIPISGQGQGERLIASYEAVDEDQFWKLWRKLSGNAKVVWEDTREEVR